MTKFLDIGEIFETKVEEFMVCKNCNWIYFFLFEDNLVSETGAETTDFSITIVLVY